MIGASTAQMCWRDDVRERFRHASSATSDLTVGPSVSACSRGQERAERSDAKVRNREEGARFGLALQGTAVAGSRTYICARMPCFSAFCAARALPSGVRARLTSRRSCGWPPRAHWTRRRRRGRLPDRVERRRTGWGRTGWGGTDWGMGPQLLSVQRRALNPAPTGQSCTGHGGIPWPEGGWLEGGARQWSPRRTAPGSGSLLKHRNIAQNGVVPRPQWTVNVSLSLAV